MRRLIIDTNLYIDWFNAGRHEDILFQSFILFVDVLGERSSYGPRRAPDSKDNC